MELESAHDIISAIQKKSKFTQENIAQKVGVSTVTLSKWFNNHCEPHPVFMSRLHEILTIIKIKATDNE